MAFPAMIDATMVARARVLLNEPTALNFTDTEIQAWIDRAANYISKDARTGEIGGGISKLTIQDATASYAYAATDISAALATATQEYNIEIDSIFYCAEATATPQTASGGYTLKKIHPRHFLHLPNSVAGPPFYWCDRNETILLHPVPAVGQATFVCDVLWYKVHNTYEDSGTTYNLPNYMKEHVLWYVMSQALFKMKRYDAANMFLGIFTKFVMFHRADNYIKPVDSMDMMIQPDYTQTA